MSLVGKPPLTSVEYDRAYRYYYLRGVSSLDASELMGKTGVSADSKSSKSSTAPSRKKMLDLVYNDVLKGIHLKPNVKTSNTILQDEFVATRSDLESDNRPEALKEALEDGTLDLKSTTRWTVSRPKDNIVSVTKDDGSTELQHVFAESFNNKEYYLKQDNSHIKTIGLKEENQYYLPCIEREVTEAFEMPFSISFKINDAPPEVVESLEGKSYSNPCIYFNLQFGDDYYLFEYDKDNTLSWLKYTGGGIPIELAGYNLEKCRKTIPVRASRQISKSENGLVQLLFIPLDSVLYIGSTSAKEDVWSPEFVVFDPLSPGDARQLEKKKKIKGPLSLGFIKPKTYNLKHIWFGAKYACASFKFNFVEYSEHGYCDYGPLTLHTGEEGAYKVYARYPTYAKGDREQCYLQGNYNQQALFGSSGSHRYTRTVAKDTISIDLFAGTKTLNNDEKYVTTPIYHKVEKQYGSTRTNPSDEDSSFSDIYRVKTWAVTNSVGGSATPMNCNGHEDIHSKSFSMSFYNLEAAQTQFSKNLNGVHPVTFKFGRDERNQRELKGFIWSDLTTTADSKLRTLKFNITDRSVLLKTSWVVQLPVYDGYYDTRIIRDLAVRAGYSNGSTNLNFDYITPKEVSWGGMKQPLWMFSEGTSYWDCMLRVAKWRGAWLFLNDDGEIVYADPAEYDRKENRGTLIKFKEVKQLGDMRGSNDLIKTMSTTQSFNQVYNQTVVMGVTPLYSPEKMAFLNPDRWGVLWDIRPKMSDLQNTMMDASEKGFIPWRRVLMWRNPDLNKQSEITKHCELMYRRNKQPFERVNVAIWGRLDIRPLQLVEVQMQDQEVNKYRIISIDTNLDGTTNKFGMNLVLEKFYGSDSYNFYGE